MGGSESKPEPPPPEPSKNVPCWREMPWYERDTMRNDILQYQPDATDVEKANIVFFGLVGSGKSSIMNTIGSVVKERIIGQAEVMSATDSSASITKKFRKYNFFYKCPSDPKKKIHCGFTLCDTMGIEEEQGLDLLDVPYILDGHIPDKFEFPEKRITPDCPGFIASPTKSDRMHALVYVVDSTKIHIGDRVVVSKFKKLRELASARDIRIVILVTKIDLLCPLVSDNVEWAYESRAVLKVVDSLSSMTGLPKSYIYVMKNYEKEGDLNESLEVLVLKALKQVLGYADDCFDNMDD